MTSIPSCLWCWCFSSSYIFHTFLICWCVLKTLRRKKTIVLLITAPSCYVFAFGFKSASENSEFALQRQCSRELQWCKRSSEQAKRHIQSQTSVCLRMRMLVFHLTYLEKKSHKKTHLTWNVFSTFYFFLFLAPNHVWHQGWKGRWWRKTLNLFFKDDFQNYSSFITFYEIISVNTEQ